MTESHTSAGCADLEPPKESRTSTVLNNVGNGMMLGGIPFLGIEAYALIRKNEKPLPKIVHGVSIAATAVGGMLGWVFGEKEANRLENYRKNIAREITTLRSEVEELKSERGGWRSHMHDEATQEKSEPISR